MTRIRRTPREPMRAKLQLTHRISSVDKFIMAVVRSSETAGAIGELVAFVSVPKCLVSSSELPKHL